MNNIQKDMSLKGHIRMDVFNFFLNMFTFLEICIIIILDNKLIKVL